MTDNWLSKVFKDKYNLEARVYPTVISFLPIGIYIFSQVGVVANPLYGLLSSSCVVVVMLYFLSDVLRSVGKYMEDKFFKRELLFPTTELLLHKSKHFTTIKKTELYQKIEKEYGHRLPTKEEEEIDEGEARKRISEVVGVIRQALRDNHPLLLQTNIRYGFWRNLIGFSPVSAYFSLTTSVMAYIFLKNNLTAIIELCFFLFFIGIWLLREEILNYFGFQYAEQFYLDFLAQR